MLAGVVSMPSNIFASTGTNVSILFLEQNSDAEHIVFMDASKLGDTVKDGKNQRTVLSDTEENRIISAFNEKRPEDDFCVVVNSTEIEKKNYSFSAGQYFDVKIEYMDITAEQFADKMNQYRSALGKLFVESNQLESHIKEQLEGLRYV